ncbi:TPA: fimbrial protein YehD [Escherichia coli]|uniref:fimbrial protein YehD n=1 Tax=Escherichia coli TaxID=562 RepID=UPI001C5F6E27|nr:fimbrial protein YehD [Escherichia coli]MCO8136221.1 fimbrial protein YehD [Escherichia coli]HDL6441757.1 fimbrial protein YehD [Escherichia coli]HDL6456419.1 fimbrial protein YehD [Escherichia coli]
MKRSVIAATVLASLFMSAGSFAAEGSTEGQLTINGKVTETTCQFLSGSENTTISMSEIGRDQFKNVEVGSPVTTYSNTTSLPLKVKCTGGKEPRITFSSTQFEGADSNITRNTGNASGVGFAVFFGEGTDSSKRISGNSPIELTSATDNGEYELHFTAQYAKAADDVSTGEVSSAITMTVVTD